MNLKELRKTNGKTQEEIAEYLHISRPTYNGYELGTIQLTTDTLVKLADYYQVSLDYLCGRNAQSYLGISYLDPKTITIAKLAQQLTDRNKDQAFYYISGLLAGQ